MKHMQKTLSIAILLSTLITQTPLQSSQKSWLASGNVSNTHKNLIHSVTSYPVLGIIEEDDDTSNVGVNSMSMDDMVLGQTLQDPTLNKPKMHKAQQYIQDRTTKATVPHKVAKVIEHGNFGILHGKHNAYQNYPQGDTLFPKYPTLSAKFDTLINELIKNPKFIPFFRKIHLNILNELYKYLMNIYTNFNLQHVGIKEVQDSQGKSSLKFNIPLFLHNEKEYDQNKKTLIINHFINVIESQMNGAIRSVMPKIPHLFATYSGKTLIQNDYSIDLTHFIVKQMEPDLKKRKKMYLEGLAVYLDFFQEYTSLLLKPHPKQDQHYTAFLHVAESINEYLHGSTTLTQNVTSEKTTTKILEKMDPPMFTFNYDDIRAIKLIPCLAKSLNPNSQKIEWPEHIVEAANEGIMIDGHPIAYFLDASGEVVREAEASKLFIVLQSGKNYFQEELVAQPDWLNTWSGVANILRGCFGDFSALIGLDILDPCMEALVQNALDTLAGKDPNEKDTPFTKTCQNLVNEWKEAKVQEIPKAKKPITENQKLQNLLEQDIQSTSTSNITQNTSNPISNDISSSLVPSLNDISNISPSSTDISSALTQ